MTSGASIPPPLAARDWLAAALRSLGYPRAETPASGLAASDWPAAARELNRHGLTPLAAAALADDPAAAGAVPAEVRAVLTRARHQAALFHQAALRALERLRPVLQSAGIPYAVLKGPHLYEAYYRDGCPRPSGDLDVLVRRRDLTRACARLREAGYTPAGGAWTRFVMRRIHFHQVLEPADKGLPKLELHDSLVDRANLYRIPDEEVLARAVAGPSATVTFPVLSPEDTLLYLALHAAKHGAFNAQGLRDGKPAEWFCRAASGNRLLWYLDLALLLRQDLPRLDAALVRERAVAWGIAEEFRDSLRVLARVFPESPATAALERLSRPGEPAAPAGRRAEGRSGSGPDRRMERGMNMSRWFIRPVRLRLLGGVLVPPPEKLRAYYRAPRWAVPLLYLWHPFHMAGKIIR